MTDDDPGQGPETDVADDQPKDDDQNDGQEDDGQSDSDVDESKDTVSKADFDKLMERMKAADRRAGAAEQKLKQKEQAEMSELDRAKTQVEEQKNRADEAEARLKSMVIENAFHRENKFEWHDVSDAIAALDLDGVEVTEDGKVTGMADAIKQVAKKKPHYVKSKQEGDGAAPPAANGANNGRRKGEQSSTLDSKALVNRFPALGK